jgi:hypothetical protein
MSDGQVGNKATLNNLSRKIQNLIDQESLVGAIIVLRSLQPELAKKVLSELAPKDRERIYDASFADKNGHITDSPAAPQPEKPREAQEHEEKPQEAARMLPFFPDQLISVLATAGLTTSLILILTIFSPAQLGVKADVLNTSMNVKPEWYFLFLYSLFGLVPSILGVVAPVVGMALLALLPFLDKNPGQEPRKRKFAILACSTLMAVLILLTLLGAYYI